MESIPRLHKRLKIRAPVIDFLDLIPGLFSHLQIRSGKLVTAIQRVERQGRGKGGKVVMSQLTGEEEGDKKDDSKKLWASSSTYIPLYAHQ